MKKDNHSGFFWVFVFFASFFATIFKRISKK